MPDGGDWNGRYHSKQYGDLEVTVKGGFARGVSQATGSKLELGGSVEGDLWRYGWTELNLTTGEIRDGRGYFRYRVRQGTHELKGEWGLGDSELGNTWEALKLMGER